MSFKFMAVMQVLRCEAGLSGILGSCCAGQYCRRTKPWLSGGCCAEIPHKYGQSPALWCPRGVYFTNHSPGRHKPLLWCFPQTGLRRVTQDSSLPIGSAAVTLADSVGTTRSATTATDGSYQIDSSGLVAPFLLKVVEIGRAHV